MSVTAVVQAGSWNAALDPLTPVGGLSMVARAVRALLDTGRVEHVVVLGPAGRAAALTRACAGLPVSVRTALSPVPVMAHAHQRATLRTGDGADAIVAGMNGSAVNGSGATGPPEILLLHDAARPLAPPELAAAVLDAVALGRPAAVPVLPVADTVKQVDPAGFVLDSPDRATLRVVQTPVALRWGPAAGRLLRCPSPPTALATVPPADVHLVPGHPLAFAVRDAGDLELAGLLAGRGVAGAGGRGH